MTQIERHQARICQICARHHKIGNSPNEDITKSPKAHHIIGKSQNFPENIYLFLEKNRNDPAVKVAFRLSLLMPIDAVCQNFLPKLKDHILPCIKEVLQIHNGTSDMDASVYHADRVVPEGSDADHNPVFFKSDHMYRHHLARFNYTTYDIRMWLTLAPLTVTSWCCPITTKVIATRNTLSCMLAFLEFTMSTWYIPERATRTTLHEGLTFYGCDGMNMTVPYLSGGKIWSLTCFVFCQWQPRGHSVL